MKSIELKKLNFQTLIEFKEHFSPEDFPSKYRYYPPRKCGNFCIDCELKNLSSVTRYPFRMSHGADTRDIEQAIGSPLLEPPNGKFVDTPVMLLGIEPGGDYDTSELIQHPVRKGIKKCVPTKHYYWTTSSEDGWPKNWSDVTWVPGPFFAYVLSHFGLRNAYFTNIVKCRLWEENRKNKKGHPSPGEDKIRPDKRHNYVDSKIRRNCIENYLKREVQLIRPEIIFVFGNDGMKILHDEPWIRSKTIVKIDHYAVVNRNMITAQNYAKKWGKIIQQRLGMEGLI